ncbi:hypothetical protein RND81_02G008300 [Saponaria officinalis]|uniref:Pectinesterase inhibitor domain-containing protein n=1 Tax=Saponaria officinalis TaxID=3572 RepID=A0AAW1MJR4_SAPOF
MTPHQNFITIAALLCTLLLAVQAANPTLITRLCGATSAPEACTRCINHQPTPSIDERDVVLSLLDCAYLDLLSLKIDTKHAIDSESTDETTRSALDQCNQLILNLISENGILNFKVGKKEFSLAKSDIDGHMSDEIKGCYRLLGAPGVTIPPKVFSGLFSVTSDYGITSQVLSLVH